MKVGRPKWLFSHSLGRALAWITLVVFVAVILNIVVIHLVGDAGKWSQWLNVHSSYFLIWRLCLYSATVYGWMWMRHRLRERDASTEAHQRLLRAEGGAIATIVLLEASILLQQP